MSKNGRSSNLELNLQHNKGCKKWILSEVTVGYMHIGTLHTEIPQNPNTDSRTLNLCGERGDCVMASHQQLRMTSHDPWGCHGSVSLVPTTPHCSITEQCNLFMKPSLHRLTLYVCVWVFVSQHDSKYVDMFARIVYAYLCSLCVTWVRMYTCTQLFQRACMGDGFLVKQVYRYRKREINFEMKLFISLQFM